MTSNQQLARWVEGESFHDDSGQCCPDFSCCKPHLKAPRKMREKFLLGSDSDRERMLFAFLRNMLSGEKVHVAGGVKEP